MRLTQTHSDQILKRHGAWITAACDKCGNLLGAVRWTRRGEPGEWCSQFCRDGVKAERVPVRKGRPRLQLSAKGRESHRRKQVRDSVERHRLGVIKKCLQSNGTEGVADAFLRPGYTPTSTAAPTLSDGLAGD
jgi:hypothetical protein